MSIVVSANGSQEKKKLQRCKNEWKGIGGKAGKKINKKSKHKWKENKKQEKVEVNREKRREKIMMEGEKLEDDIKKDYSFVWCIVNKQGYICCRIPRRLYLYSS